jgi:hypothetical protein
MGKFDEQTKYFKNGFGIYFSPRFHAYILETEDSKYALDCTFCQEAENSKGLDLLNKLYDYNSEIISDLSKKGISLEKIRSAFSDLKRKEEKNFQKLIESNDL